MKNGTTSYEIAPNLFLVHQPIVAAQRNTISEGPTNHLLLIDCSGSMGGELPLIRKQLKAKLPKLLKDDDTISIIWFSGKGEFGTLCEGEKVNGLSELKSVNDMLDRWLRPVGLTGFKEPLQLIGKVITDVKNKNPWSLFFMSDGCDNQWDRASILKAVESAAGKLSAATFVEYGYYADRALLAAMAEKAGGTHIFAESFPKFEPVLDAALMKRVMGNGKRMMLKINGDVIGGFAFAGRDAELQTFAIEGTEIAVPEGLPGVWYLSPSKVGEAKQELKETAAISSLQTRGFEYAEMHAAYAALSLFAVRMKPDIVFPLLKALGDVQFIESFSTCFGKQKYSAFMQAAHRAAFNIEGRFTKGYNPNLVPPDDAFTVLDFLNLIAEDDEARVLLDHPAFEYNRIGRATLDADEYLTVDEQEKLEALQGEQKATRNAKKLKEIQAEMDALLAKKRTALKFTATPRPDGYEISGLTWNETKPNISVLICKEGTVNLAERIGEAKDAQLAGITFDFPTKIFRNYAIIKDGLVNVGKLPITASKTTIDKLCAAGVPLTMEVGYKVVVVDLLALPVLCRKDVKQLSAKALIELQYKLTTAKAAQKVYNAVQKSEAPPARGSHLAAKYGDYCAKWLEEQGITDGGFSPKSTQAESKDFYIARTLDVKLKGLASLPKVDEVRAKLAPKSPPPTGGAGLMAPFVKEVDEFMKDNPAKLHKDYIQGKAKTQRAIARGLIFQKAKAVFTMVVGQTWPPEFKSLDENTLTVKIDGKDIVGTIEMKEEQVKI
jgi:hypothetical protein